MPPNPARAILVATECNALSGARIIGAVSPDERFEVTVRVRRRMLLEGRAAEGWHADRLPSERRYLTRPEYAASHGADPADLARVAAFAESFGLIVVERSPARRSVFLSGTAGQFAQAFGTEIAEYQYPEGSYRGRTGALSVPADLLPLIEGVFGIDNRPIARPHFQRARDSATMADRAVANTFTPTQLAKLYDFPTGGDGSGQCIALIELGGGYRTTDLTAYFQKLGIPTPKVKTVRVSGGNNLPTTSDGPDGEVMLDIEVAGAVAPGAEIAVYFAPNSEKGFLDAITMAIHDTVNKPTVISISWGSAETHWTAQATATFDEAFQSAAALGVSICCAAGDRGSSDGEADGRAHADFPASSPFVLGCGGTKLIGAGTSIRSESVWNENSDTSASGGGISDVFGVPSYQAAAGVPASANPGVRKGRGVPDVAGDADPATGYLVRVDGAEFIVGGTSAVAPLWAGLIALMNQTLGQPVGFLNPLLYGSLARKGSTRDITSGNNGAYSAKSGWDPCTGLGSPVGSKLLQALRGSAELTKLA